MKTKVFARFFILLAMLYCSTFATLTTQKALGQNVVQEFLTIIPDIVGAGINKFLPETFVVNQGDTVNVSIRNLVNQTYSLTIENTTESTIRSAVAASNGSVTPTDSLVPSFTASQAGIFSLQTSQDPNLIGYMVVLPNDWNRYSPTPTERDVNIIAIPDFAGDSYDKFFPNYFIVNQYDTVNLTLENADLAYHGFAMAAQNVSVSMPPANATQNGTIVPSVTNVPQFNTSAPGNFEFDCTVFCGPGHVQMTGTLTVLPTNGNQYTPTPVTDYEYLVVKPDFAGPSYDKFVPPVMVVNQNDLVYIVARNTANISESLLISVFDINYTLTPANASGPIDTYVAPFFASQSGVYQYSSATNTNAGDIQMVGYLVVLPTLQGEATPTTAETRIDIVLVIVAAVLLLILGFIGGLVTATRLSPQSIQSTKKSETVPKSE